jgi:hypothetical protein
MKKKIEFEFVQLVLLKMKPNLTRFLYQKSEVKHSLICSILKKTSFDECLFWTSEFYYSGYFIELWDLIWKIYYDFYAIIHPKLERFITKMKEKWDKKRKIVYILHIFKNFYFNNISSPIVFLVRMALETQKLKTKSYRGRPPHWLKGTNQKYKNLILSIHNKHYKNIAYYLQRFKDERSEIRDIILNYYKDDLSDKFIYESNYPDKLHILIDTMFHLSLEDDDINARNIHLQVTKDELKYATETNVITCKLYKVLKEKRKFQIRTQIGCFKLGRHNSEYPNVQQIQWYHWKYFAYNTPIWKERFDKYKIKLDDKKFKLEFENDDDDEDFHEKYYYEPDEQSKEVQERSIADIHEFSINDWIINIFGDEEFFRLDDKNKYRY